MSLNGYDVFVTDKNIFKLSPREIEILALIANSEEDKVIARSLGIAVSTVRKHYESMRRKMDIPEEGNHKVAMVTTSYGAKLIDVRQKVVA